MNRKIPQYFLYLSLFFSFIFLLKYDTVERVYKWSRQYKEYGADFWLLLLPFLLLMMGVFVFFRRREQQVPYEQMQERHTQAPPDSEKKRHANDILQHMEMAVCRWLPDFSLTYANKACLDLFQIEGDLHNYQWGAFLSPKNAEASSAFYEEFLQHPHRTSIEHQIQLEEGKERTIRWSHRPICDAGGHLLEIQSVGVEVTAYKEQEQRLLNKETTFRNLSETAPIGFFLTNAQGACVYTNPKCLELTGLSEEESLGMGWSKNIHPEDKERVEQEWMEAFQQQGACTHEYRWLHQDGTLITTLGMAEPYVDSNGELGGYVGTLIDVSQRIEREKTLMSSEAQFRTLAQSLPIGIFQNDVEGNCVYLNPACAEMIGMSIEESMGSGWLPAVHPEDQEQVMADWIQVIANGDSLHNEARWLHKDGRIVHTLGIAIPRLNEEGQLEGYIGSLYDLTDRKEIEEALQKSEAQFRTLAQSSPMGIFQHDTFGNCVYMNPRCSEMIGTPLEACLGSGWLRTIHPDSRQPLMEQWEKVLMEGGTFNGEAKWVHDDGTIIETLGIVVPVRNQEEKLEGFLGTLMDVTERKKAEKILTDHQTHLQTLVDQRTTELSERIAEVEQLNKRLETANEELEGFSYSVSHDLRSPLRHINGFIGLLKKREQDQLDAGSLRFIDLTIEAVQKMNQLINDLLAFSRTNRTEIQTEYVDLNELILGVREEVLPAFEQREIDWKIQELPTVKADPNLLRVVWANLLNNALKYTTQQPSPLIEVGGDTEERDKEVLLFVRDNGVGFDQQYAHKIFGVFQRLHREEEFEGTGIGLATVRRIIQRHGGQIWAEGEVDKGASIYFTLPKI
ncbi:MAG: PAS domain S-box protein [Bacteroidota bacterium]